MSHTLTKSTSYMTIFVLFLQLLIPVYAYSAEANSEKTSDSGVISYFSKIPSKFLRNYKSSAEDLTPEQMEEVIARSQTKTFVGNPTLREEKSTFIRPLKQVALKVLDGEVGILKTFLSFQGANFLRASVSGSSSKKVLGTSRQVVNLMSPTQLAGLNRALQRLDLPKSMRKYMGKMSPGLKGFRRTEGNFALMGVIGALISMGIYDALDLNTMKDKILALDPLAMNNTVSHALIPTLASEMSKRHFFSFFNNRFDAFYDKMLKSTSFGGKILKSLELKADVLGAKISKASRMGFTKPAGKSLAKQLGLVGVGEGTKFALKDFMRSVSTGLAFGLVGNVVVESVLVGVKGYEDATVIGGNRNKHSFRPEYNAYLNQRSKSKTNNWLNERRFALMDLWDGYKKTPITKVVSAVTGFAGAYLGSVVAGAFLVGGGLPAMVGGVMIASLFGGIGDFVGRWTTTKFERSDSMKNFRRSLVEKRLFKALKKMSLPARDQWDETKIRSVAKDRSQDMYKRESFGQVYNRMYLVEDFSKVQLYESGEYVKMKVTEDVGEEFDLQAHIRYDLVSLQGDQGIWDILTNQIFNVGNVQANNGFRVVLLTDDENLSIQGDTIQSQEGTNFRVLSNGLVMTKSDLDSKKWVIKGQNVNTDLFLRNQKIRFAWDYDTELYRRVGSANESEQDPLQPLLQTFDYLDEDSGKQAVRSKVLEMISSSRDQAMENIENTTSQEEAAYFQNLEENGASAEAIQQLILMEEHGWKTLLRGKIHRGTPSAQNSFLNKIETEDFENLKHSLKTELENPATDSIWDQLRILLEPASLSARFAK